MAYWRFTGLLVALFPLLAPGCAGRSSVDMVRVRANLARVGLELMGEEHALIPSAEAGRFLPCQVIPGFFEPALDHHPAGYLLLGVKSESPNQRDQRDQDDRIALLSALTHWHPGETLQVKVRRNPYLMEEPEWWEAIVELRMPR